MRLLALWLMFVAVLLTAGCGSRDTDQPPAASTGPAGDERPTASEGPAAASQGRENGKPQAAAAHHRIILLDDSLSMAAQWQGRSAYQRGRAFLEQLAINETAPKTIAGTVSLLRFSQAASSGNWDLRSLPADQWSPEQLTQAVPESPSLTAAGPLEALAACQALMAANAAGDRHTVYIISDFRRRNWAEASVAQAKLAKLAQRPGVEVVLVPTSAGQEQNLAVSALAVPSIPTPGQPSRLTTSLRNFGPEAVARPPLTIFGQQQTGGLLPRTELSTPGVLEPQTTAQLPYEFTLADSAPVIVEANLTVDDALPADNTRYLYFEVPEALRVLVVDELAADVAPGRFIAAALSPLPEVATGYHVEQAGPSALEKPLHAYATVIIANVPRLAAAAVTNLKQYAEGGGAIVYFASKDSNARYLSSQLYDEGRGLLPFPVEDIAALPPAPASKAAEDAPPPGDVQFEADRRAFAVFTDKQFGGTFQQSLRIARYLKVPQTWQPGEGVEVLARLRDGSPLIVEQRLGQGRAVYILTAIDPAWTNWMSQPSWVVFNLELQSELHPLEIPSHVLGQPLRVALDGAKYQPRASWSKAWPKPEGAGPEVQILNARSGGIADGRPLWFIELNPSEPGVYELILDTLTGEQEARYCAWNIDPAEGDLRPVDLVELAAMVEGKIRIEPAEGVAP